MASSYLEELRIDASDGTVGATLLEYLHFESIPASLHVAPPWSCHSSLTASWLAALHHFLREDRHCSSACLLWV